MLDEVEIWVITQAQENKMDVIEIKMLRWMTLETRRGKI